MRKRIGGFIVDIPDRVDPVIVTHEGRRLGIHPSHSHAMRRLRRYPVGAHVIRVRDGAWLCTRVAAITFPRTITFQRMGVGESKAGAGRLPDFETVRPIGRAA